MQVKNNTRSAFNYGGRIYGPGRVIELKEGDESKRDIAALIESEALSVQIGTKASEGLTVEQLKAVLTENKIDFDPSMKKAELAALVDSHVQP
jgi:hypothetical protein